MASLCCFWCPKKDFSERTLDSTCPSCNRTYRAPLDQRPNTVGNYIVEESISRGFYSVAYRARQVSLGRTVVLKVVPVAVYECFGKDWAAECTDHAQIAEGTPFVANITDQFSADVAFGDSVLSCHVAVLENIVGPTLEQLLANPDGLNLNARAAAQISADLFEIFHVFINHGHSHNDLHAGNIIVQRLSQQTLRSNAIDATLRAVAIDLGSVSDASKSGDHHIGDQHQVARHLAALSAAIRRPSAGESDIDYRIASALRGLAEHLAPAADAQRVMTADDARQFVVSAVKGINEPWRQPLTLHQFSDAYNAQSLESWHVPQLWIDPDNRWLQRTTVRGPQVITGMRGCGKTMLLRALHFHARAAQASQITAAPITELAKDGFIGLFASCQKLLDPQDHGAAQKELPKPFERLFVAYVRDAVQVLRHLRSLDPQAVVGDIDTLLKGSLEPLELGEPVPTGELPFEQFLLRLQFALAEGKAHCVLRTAPTEAFSHLAKTVQDSAPLFAGKYLLFLLDDVSTRYLGQDVVRKVISQLLFQHAQCGFRITTEAQALHRVLLSPGGSEPADFTRDYDEFNLGNEVYRLLQEGSTRQKMNFIADILRKRGSQFPGAIYQREPLAILGNVPAEKIAREIVASSTSSAARKRVYRGLRAVQAVCVGDLGDVVKMYDKIVQHADLNALPVPDQIQCDCFLEHSASLMHFLNRRDQQKKGLALAFAQAAGELLQRSAKVEEDGRPRRLRQYTKLYVRVDAGSDFETVANNILALLDAGVFVYDGGVPRTKTRDDDPVLQFKLSYRKTLGLASFIGIADRDRFELSGDTLRRWLDHPDEARDILIDSEAARNDDEEPEAEPDESDGDVEIEIESVASTDTVAATPPGEQLSLLTHESPPTSQLALELGPPPDGRVSEIGIYPSLGVSVENKTLDDWSRESVEVAVLALGFEERTLRSAERILAAVRPRRVVLVRYSEDQGREVAALVESQGLDVSIVAGHQELVAAVQGDAGLAIIDSSGLSKPFLFEAVRNALAARKRVGIVHTLAEHYYPRNQDLNALGITAETPANDVLARLGPALMGEVPPYRLIPVYQTAAQPERWRAVLASASPKNDRLLHLLDERAYDAVRILVPPPTTARRRVALAAAELAASAADTNVSLVTVDTNDIKTSMNVTEQLYNELYRRSGANVEIGLTGSKMHAVAFGALAAAARVAAAWYVAPAEVDMTRFTIGASDTHCFELRLKS